MISRNDADVLIPVEVKEQIIQGAIANSVAMSAFKRLANMTSDKERMPVLDLLPIAYWVNEKRNNGRKGITKLAWDDRYIVAREIAVVIPIKQNTLDDSSYDIWGESLPRVGESFGKLFDKAVFTGEGKPGDFREDIVTSVINAGAYVEQGSDQSLYSAINDAMVKVEESGYEVSGIIGGVDLKGKFRMMLDSTGQPIANTEIGALKKVFVKNGAWDKTKAMMIVGDLSEAVYSIRQDINAKILTEGVIQDPETGDILYNLGQDDMVALRVTMRIGWQIPNPVNSLEPDESVRFPFAAIKAYGSAGVTTQNVTFTVTDTNSDPVEGVKITAGGVSKKTNASGQAVIKLQSGEHDYTAKKDDAKAAGSVTVAGSAVSVNIVNF